MDKLRVQLDSGTYGVADLTRLPGRHQHIALIPQWDFLNVIADASRQEPSYELIMRAEVTDLLWDGQRISGVTYSQDGQSHSLEADLVVGCDGRSSVVGERAGLKSRTFGVPMDVLWFRLPRLATDPEGALGRISRSNLLIMIDRGDYFQIGMVIRKGSLATLRDHGIDALRQRLGDALPWLEIGSTCSRPSTTSGCSTWRSAGCRAGIAMDCCVLATLLTPCRRSVVSGSTWLSRMRSLGAGFLLHHCVPDR